MSAGGTLTVIRDLDMKNTYNGQVAIHSGEIAEDLTWYFMESEQIPSSVGLGVLVDTDCSIRRSGGFLVQLMPFAQENVISRLEENLRGLPSVTELLEAGMDPEQMLRRILDGFDLEVTASMPVSFRCSCTRERVEQALILLGKKELEEMIGENRIFSINCHFCGKQYDFSRADLEALLPEAR